MSLPPSASLLRHFILKYIKKTHANAICSVSNATFPSSFCCCSQCLTVEESLGQRLLFVPGRCIGRCSWSSSLLVGWSTPQQRDTWGRWRSWRGRGEAGEGHVTPARRGPLVPCGQLCCVIGIKSAQGVVGVVAKSLCTSCLILPRAFDTLINPYGACVGRFHLEAY